MKRNYYLVALIMLTFFVISFITNVIGALNPDIKQAFSLSDTLVANLPFVFFIAYGVISIPTSMLVEKFRQKKIVVAGFGVAFVGALLLALAPGYLNLLLSLFIIGCGMAMLQVVINPLLRTAGGEEHYAFYSVLAQLIFGGASYLSPRVYSYLVQHLNDTDTNVFLSALNSLTPHNLIWISLYWLFTIISLLMIIIILISKFPKVELSDEEKVGAWHTIVSLFKKRIVVLFFIGMICYVGTEQGTSYWISQFLSRYHHYDPDTVGANAVSWFWGLMTIGGILGLLLVKLLDSRKVLIIFTVLALVCLTAALFGPAKISLWAFPAVGFFASVMYPIIFSLALNSVSEEHGSFSGIILTGIIGGAIAPFVIGGLSDLFGLRSGMFFLYLTLGYILSIGFWAKPIIKNKTIFDKKEMA
jgi:fucose permease